MSKVAVAAVSVGVIAALIVSLLGLPESGEGPRERESADPPQGIYEGCAPQGGVDRCAARLAEIAEAGFTHVINYSAWYGSRAEVIRYADAAEAVGLSLVWPLNHSSWIADHGLLDAYGQLAGSCRCDDNQAFIAYAVNLVKGHPATWGFYVGDEEAPEDAAKVEALSARVRSLAPGRPQLLIAAPGKELLEPFAPFVDIAGADSYPLGSDHPPVAQTAAETRALTRRHGAMTAMVLQAFSWSQYDPARKPRYPTAEEMREMKRAAIRHAEPDLLLWYSYQDVRRSPRPGHRWRALVRAAFPTEG